MEKIIVNLDGISTEIIRSKIEINKRQISSSADQLKLIKTSVKK